MLTTAALVLQKNEQNISNKLVTFNTATAAFGGSKLKAMIFNGVVTEVNTSSKGITSISSAILRCFAPLIQKKQQVNAFTGTSFLAKIIGT